MGMLRELRPKLYHLPKIPTLQNYKRHSGQISIAKIDYTRMVHRYKALSIQMY